MMRVRVALCSGRSYRVLLDMPPKKPYARIAITLPAEDLEAADRLARDQRRPRSWIVAEAVRRYAADTRASLPAVAGLGPSRTRQLIADLELTPLERVRAAEETARVTALRRPPVQQVVAFDRYEDYLAWKRIQEVGG